ncbi:MAG: hypothetical protein PF447_06815, partial [Spirochaetaceae bacterium]|nr:hypothetical protein [Spirochaetaceae bacterium]
MCPDKLTLSIWMDGELPREASSIIGKHVDNCQNCKNWVAKIQSQQKKLKSIETPIDPSVEERIYKKITQGNIREARFLKKQIPWGVAAGLVVMFTSLSLITGYSVANRTNDRPPLVDVIEADGQNNLAFQNLFDNERWPFAGEGNNDVIIMDVDASLSYLGDATIIDTS